MITANRVIECCFYDQDGDPMQGVTVTFSLAGYDLDNGCVVAPDPVSAITDASGEATISTWPNQAGELGTTYSVVAVDGSEDEVLTASVYVPDAPNLKLSDLLDQPILLGVQRRNFTLFDGYPQTVIYTVENPDESMPDLGFYIPRFRVWEDSTKAVLVFDSDADSGVNQTINVAEGKLTLRIETATHAAWVSGYYYEESLKNPPVEYPMAYGTIYRQP